VRKFGTVSILGVYCGFANHFPIGPMMEKGLTIRGGQCPAQKFIKFCMEKVQSGEIDPTFLVTGQLKIYII
jgi:threonine dehydrogenase-like Zn-dependent dehydrogenase